MPVSQRNKVVSTGKVQKKTKGQRQKMYYKMEEGLKEYSHCYILHCENQRNQYLKEVRQLVQGIWMFGKSKMAKKCFTENKILDILKYVKGDVGILLTNTPIDELRTKLAYTTIDYARTGMRASESIKLKELKRNDGEALPSSMLEQLKKLRVPVKLEMGTLVLEKPYTLCSNNQKMTNEQCQVAKMLCMPLAKTEIRLIAHYDGTKTVNCNAMEE
eukprot:NODE_595_length_5602_cov_0.719062.p3 type:complete len:216 gc:universal NODE_595_length_5602_cov_0.719062:4071-3424(-)